MTYRQQSLNILNFADNYGSYSQIEGLIDTWSEDRRSDTNHGRVTLHGDREIMTHAPASLLEGRVISKEF